MSSGHGKIAASFCSTQLRCMSFRSMNQVLEGFIVRDFADCNKLAKCKLFLILSAWRYGMLMAKFTLDGSVMKVDTHRDRLNCIQYIAYGVFQFRCHNICSTSSFLFEK